MSGPVGSIIYADLYRSIKIKFSVLIPNIPYADPKVRTMPASWIFMSWIVKADPRSLHVAVHTFNDSSQNVNGGLNMLEI